MIISCAKFFYHKHHSRARIDFTIKGTSVLHELQIIDIGQNTIIPASHEYDILMWHQKSIGKIFYICGRRHLTSSSYKQCISLKTQLCAELAKLKLDLSGGAGVKYLIA